MTPTDSQGKMFTSLQQLQFDNRLVNSLPADAELKNYPRQVTQAIYSRVRPQTVSAPDLIAASPAAAELLNLSPEVFLTPEFAQVFSGNELLDGMAAHACCYGGHQFGNWAGQLGDGRAINLGEVKTHNGAHWTLQLKGAGPTPYSRTADGLAVLRSSVREFLCSEAMHFLGVPTTRALSLVATGEQVMRDMFYNGNARFEPGAVVCRLAPSFTRFGNFELLAARGDYELLKQLADFTIRADFPELISGDEISVQTYSAWFQEICRRTAIMIAHWMRVGFVHGVMNTDNMSILGLTIDYGPYGWLEAYDPNWTPNTTDAQGRRYRFANQPRIALWNLAQLGNALYPLINDLAPLEAGLAIYRDLFAQQSQQDITEKLGLKNFDADLVDALYGVFQSAEIDMTIFFRLLADIEILDSSALAKAGSTRLLDVIGSAYYAEPDANAAAQMTQWLNTYLAIITREQQASGETNAQRRARMNRVNPKYVLRNYLAQQAIDLAEAGDYSEVKKLLELLAHPYAEQPEHQAYFAKRPEWARHKAGCSMLSCSS